MRVRVPYRVQSLSGRLAPINWTRLAERLLLAVLMLQCARLVWAIVTPVGVYGDWQGRQAQMLSPSARLALFSSFDPFFRTGAEAKPGGVVTSLALTLYGIRLNEGSGLGSAIIAGPDEVQNSYAVGDEIMPGVVLKAVAFDHAVIDRGGAEEQLFLDQSTPAPDGDPAAVAPPAVTPSAVTPLSPPPAARVDPTAEDIKRDIGFAPRTEQGRITGLVVSSRGPAFAAAGFQSGDIITQVNGRPVGDLQMLQRQLSPGARLSLAVERGAGISTINLTPQGQ
jgi:general secretion pathway protein C